MSDPTGKEIASTARTANIEMLDDEISVFVNEYGQRTPLLIVGRCRCDGIEYAVLFHCGLTPDDPDRGKSYVVEVIREKGQIKYFRDLDSIRDGEAWDVVSHFFLEENVLERNRIYKWIWNTRLSAALGTGIPSTTLERWHKKKLKKR